MKFLQFLKDVFVKKFWIKFACLAIAVFITMFLYL